MASTIGEWNPAWGPEPQWQGPAQKRSYPKNVALLLRCPQGCTKEDVVVFGRRQTYFCASCQSEMEVARLIKERQPPPTVVQPGDRYGRLVVQRVIRGGSKVGRTKAWCLCDCGTTKAVQCAHLRAGVTRSCGCLQREVLAAHPWRESSR